MPCAKAKTTVSFMPDCIAAHAYFRCILLIDSSESEKSGVLELTSATGTSTSFYSDDNLQSAKSSSAEAEESYCLEMSSMSTIFPAASTSGSDSKLVKISFIKH